MKKSYTIFFEIICLIIGNYLFVFGVNSLLLPFQLLSAGITGICQIFYFIFAWPVGFQYFIINIPLLVLGYFYIGKKFMFYTIFSVILSSFFFYLIPVQRLWTDNIMLASIFGSIISCFGGALVLRAGGSVGGLDILSRIIAKYSNISIAQVGLVINIVIILIATFMYNAQIAMFTIVSLYVGAQTYDIMLDHARKISVVIVTEKGEEVAYALTHLLQRGVTNWNAQGSFSQKEKKVLLCIIVKLELKLLCSVVQKIDPGAFISVAYSQKIVGKFKSEW